MNAPLTGLSPSTYQRHPVHSEGREWAETNCYVDLWIELLHALRLDPVAAMAFTLGMDFEGEQWSFFKFPLEDLRALWGFDVAELNIWLPLERHLEEQLGQDRTLIVELDSWFLPDTAGSAYHAEHVKTSVAAAWIDVQARRLGYFHGPGYFELEGDDFDGVLRRGAPLDPMVLPPYVEVVKLEQLERPSPESLLRTAVELTRTHVARRPMVNPVSRFRERFARDLPWLTGEKPELFHQYAFATLRQLGPCAELAATYLRWLAERGEAGLEPSASHWDTISATAKAMQLKLARAAAGRSVDFEPLLDVLEQSWRDAMLPLVARYGS
jgi:hypothetical protein